MEVTAGWTPAPDRLILTVGALLAIDTLPVTGVVPAGLNVTFILVLCPGFRMVPLTPLAVKPDPPMVVFEMFTAALPELVKDTLNVLSMPMVVLPKFKLAGLAVSCAVPEFTVRVAALLLALPAELLTATVNVVLLSVDFVAGVV